MVACRCKIDKTGMMAGMLHYMKCPQFFKLNQEWLRFHGHPTEPLSDQEIYMVSEMFNTLGANGFAEPETLQTLESVLTGDTLSVVRLFMWHDFTMPPAEVPGG